MKPMILLTHGSRHPHASAGFDALAQAVGTLLPELEVHIAHLEFSEDTLAAVSARTGDGAVVVPLLFSSGYHSTIDVPEEIAEVPQDLTLAQPLGAGEDIAQVLISKIPRDHTGQVVVWSVGSSRQGAKDDIDRLVALVAKQTGLDVVSLTATNILKTFDELEPGYVVVPLFVTEGLLLDAAHHKAAPNTFIAAPLAASLAPIVAARYLEAVAP